MTARTTKIKPIGRILAFFFIGSMVVSTLASCSIFNEASGKNDDGFEDILKIVNQVQTFQKFQQGLDWANFVGSVSASGTLPTAAETDDAYPGTTPVSSAALGACYIDNKGTVSGFDMCCYNIKQSDCFNVASIFTSGYDITFVAGSVAATACTGSGFSQQTTSGAFTCYTK